MVKQDNPREFFSKYKIFASFDKKIQESLVPVFVHGSEDTSNGRVRKSGLTHGILLIQVVPFQSFVLIHLES